MSIWEDSSDPAGLVLAIAELGDGKQQDHVAKLGSGDLGESLDLRKSVLPLRCSWTYLPHGSLPGLKLIVD